MVLEPQCRCGHAGGRTEDKGQDGQGVGQKLVHVNCEPSACCDCCTWRSEMISLAPRCSVGLGAWFRVYRSYPTIPSWEKHLLEKRPEFSELTIFLRETKPRGCKKVAGNLKVGSVYNTNLNPLAKVKSLAFLSTKDPLANPRILKDVRQKNPNRGSSFGRLCLLKGSRYVKHGWAVFFASSLAWCCLGRFLVDSFVALKKTKALQRDYVDLV